MIEFDIELMKNSKPHKRRVQPLNLAQRNDLRKQLDQWLEQKVIKPSVLPWGAALVPVLKKDG